MYEVEFVTSAAKEFRSLEEGIKHRVAVAIAHDLAGFDRNPS